jgi:CDP-4-dehydro-6-deoxyglucose reductase, E1
MSKKIEIKKLVEKYGHDFSKYPRPGKDLIQYSGPTFDTSEFEAAIDVLLDGWFGLGEKAEEFELQTAHALGKEFGVFVNSGSSANLVALLTIRELFKDKISGSRNKVIVPASSFPTTVNPIIQLGFEPLFVDVEFGTYAPVYDQVIAALERHDVIGMMFAHPLGNPVVQTKEYYEKLNKAGGFLIEDCCDCLGGKYLDVPVGTYSHAATLSTYMAHHITSGEGGMVCFNRKKHQRIAKSFRDWGRGCFCSGKDVLSVDGACGKRFSCWIDNNVSDHRYIYERLGYNLKPIEMQAAIGLVQLKKLEGFVKARNNNFKHLGSLLSSIEGEVHLPYSSEFVTPSWFSYPITIKKESLLTRDLLTKSLESKKIQTRTFFAGNVLKHPAYQKIAKSTPYSLKNSDLIYKNTFMVGVWPGINFEAIEYIADNILSIVSGDNT